VKIGDVERILNRKRGDGNIDNNILKKEIIHNSRKSDFERVNW